MRVETKIETVTVYYFNKYEVTCLCDLGVWEMLNKRLNPFERIEIDYS